MSNQITNEAVLDEKPLVTFALFAYNQEKYIREAVEGAFSQTYSPLEIILSDDCSTDRTFEIMREIASEYSGPHEVILNRNEKNNGLAGHINRVMDLANGELIVVAAGDDVSLMERTSEIVDFYLSQGKPDSIFSDFHQMDERGIIFDDHYYYFKPFEQNIVEFIDCPKILGAAHAWTKRIFNLFGHLSTSVLCEDQVIPFRAYFLNQPRYIDKKLVLHRSYKVKASKYECFYTSLKRQLTSKNQYMCDSQKIHVPSDIVKKIEAEIAKFNSLFEFWNADGIAYISTFFGICKTVGVLESSRWLIRRLLCVLSNG